MSKTEQSVLPRWRVTLNEIITKWHMLRPDERGLVTHLDYGSDEDADGRDISTMKDIANRLGIA